MNGSKEYQKKLHSSPPRRAQALVEVMVAVAMLTVGFLGIVTLLSRALALNRVVADNYTATYLAAEGIEITKNIIDGNTIQKKVWNVDSGVGDCKADGGIGGCEVDPDSTVLRRYTGQPLGFDSNTKMYNYGGGNAPTTFRRRVIITLIGQTEIQVESQVTWTTRGGGTSEITLEDHFYDWR